MKSYVVVNVGDYSKEIAQRFWECILWQGQRGDCPNETFIRQEAVGTRPMIRGVSFEKWNPSVSQENGSGTEGFTSQESLWGQYSMTMKYTGGLFGEGRERLQDTELQENAVDLIRKQVEKCNWFNGLITITDSIRFWGGFSSVLLESVNDELAIKNVDSFGLFDGPNFGPHDPLDTALNLYYLQLYSKRAAPILLDCSRNVEDKSIATDLVSLLDLQYKTIFTDKSENLHAKGLLEYFYHTGDMNGKFSSWKSMVTGEDVSESGFEIFTGGQVFRPDFLRPSKFIEYNLEFSFKEFGESLPCQKIIDASILHPLSNNSSFKRSLFCLENAEEILRFFEGTKRIDRLY